MTTNDLKSLLDGTRIATVFLDTAGRVNSFTPTVRDIYHIEDRDVGRPLEEISHKALVMPAIPSLEAIVGNDDYVEDEIQASESRWFLRRALPYQSDDTAGVILTFVDVSQKKRDEMRLAAAHSVTQLLVDTDSFPEAVPQLLDRLRETLNADACSLWLLDDSSTRLYCTDSSVRTGSEALTEFAKQSTRWRFEIGKGLPGRVWETREPLWIEDVTSAASSTELYFDRHKLATSAGLVSGIAFPIMSGKRFRGVIELFANRMLDREQSLLDMLRDVGHEVGQFIRRKRLDDRVRDEESRRAAILAASIDCIITIDMRGNIVDFNKASEQTFGYQPSDVTGKPLTLLMPEGNRDQHRASLQRYLETGETNIIGRRVELMALHADGSQFPIELAVNVSHNRHGSPFFTGYLRDITARKLREQNLSALAKIEHAAAEAESVEQIQADVLRLITERLQAESCCLVNIDNAFLKADVFAEHIGPNMQSLIGSYDIADFYTPKELRTLRETKQLIINDCSLREPPHRDNMALLNINAICEASYVNTDSGRFTIAVMDSKPRQWTGEDCDFLRQATQLLCLRIERVQSRTALAERESHLRRVIDNTLYFIGVLSLDGTLLEANATAIQAGGVEREDVIGKKFWDCYWWSFDKSTQDQLKDDIQRALAGEVVRRDVPVRMAGGIRMTIDFMLSPMRDDEGRITHLIPSGVDIDDRKNAERELLEAKSRLDLAMLVSKVAAWSWDLETHQPVTDDNLKRLFGFTSEEDPDFSDFIERMHAEDRDRVETAIRRALETGGEYDEEYRLVLPTGETRWLHARGRTTHARDGKVEDFYGVVSDVTSKKQHEVELETARQQAESASRAKSQFVANMSHEIRTPMTAVLGYADLLLAGEDDPEKLTHLQTIKRNGNFLLEIINDILDLSKIEAGKLDIAKEWFSVVEVVEDVRSMMHVRAVENDLDFRVEFDGEIPERIESDAKRLRQILINLIGNAIKFTTSGGVTLRLRELRGNDSNTIQFQVIDTGIGISRDQQGHLFQAFRQGDASVSRAFGGTGLGLAISQRLANMLGGEIRVESEAGRGSCFSFTIATGDLSNEQRIQPTGSNVFTKSHEKTNSITTLDQEHADSNVQPSSSDADKSLSCHVLVVDDRRDVRYLSKAILTRAGATVDEAEDGLEVVERFKADSKLLQATDIILLDMQMPRLDGYETARQLRKMKFTNPIVALTADALQSDMNRCIESGCNDYLSKPIDTRKLIETVSRLVSR